MLKKSINTTLLFLISAIGIQSSIAVASDDANRLEWHGASQVVVGSMGKMLQIISDSDVQDNVAKSAALMSELSDFVDYRAIAKGVMAIHYRRASEEQFNAFVEVFQKSLESTYTKGLTTFKIDGYSLQEYAGYDGRKGREKVVLIVNSGDEIFNMAYTMSNKSGGWKIVNLTLDGVNLGLAFRNQFAEVMGKNGNNIDEAIEFWRQAVLEA